MTMLPNARLLARAFHRTPVQAGTTTLRRLSTTSPTRKWEGRQAEENTTREGDHHNVQHDASREGKRERAVGDERSGATSEKDLNNENKKAKEEYPEAPGPVIGMNDERGGKGS